MSKQHGKLSISNRLRRGLAGILSLALLLGLLPAAAVPAAAADHWAVPYVQTLTDWGVMRGDISGNMAPERSITRAEFVTMMNRAYGYTRMAGHPFTDVPAWLDPYAAWAFRQGYSNGVSGTSFDPDAPMSAAEYQELLLRALGYSAAGVDDYSASLERALDCGALTGGEYALLTQTPFRRAHAAYLSYYSLDMPVAGAGQTLAQRMAAAGLLTVDQLAAARTETFRLT